MVSNEYRLIHIGVIPFCGVSEKSIFQNKEAQTPIDTAIRLINEGQLAPYEKFCEKCINSNEYQMELLKVY
jgi:hypothetical protein